MRILTISPTILSAIAACFFATNMHSQSASVTVSQEPEFEKMLNEKRRINSSITVSDRYKIQIYNGDSESSKKILTDFKREFTQFDGTIVFSTPAYKVWVGNFKSRIEAERNLDLLKKRFPTAILVRPNK